VHPADGDQAVADGVVRVAAEDLDGAGARRAEAEHHVDRAGLAGAVRAEERDDLAAADGEVDAVDGLDGAEVLGEPGEVEGGGTRRLVHALNGDLSGGFVPVPRVIGGA
jgi:hypothetical protein